jgi:subtilisin family serine protease
VLIIFRHDAPQNVEDFARDYRLVHIESYTDSLLGRTVHLGGSAGPDKHGTAIAGAIVSHGDLLGVAPAARILAVGAFNDAGGTTLTITRGINWSFQSGARIINMSFAGPKDPLLHREVTAAYNRGLILVAAAGNAGTDSPPMYPAAYPEVIAVTATDSDDRVLQQANTGRYVAIAAPGVEIVAPHPGRTYQFSTGTSIAAAHVSGVAALLLERNPQLRPDEIRSILVATADKVKTGEFVPGRVNALKALIVITKMPAGSSSTHQISVIRR